MRKKLIIRYGLLCLPFICGLVLYITGSYNIISSLLFFVGGYIAVKNLGDYRKIKRNIRLSYDSKKDELDVLDNDKNNTNDREISNDIGIVKEMNDINNIEYRSYDSISGLKRTRRYTRVRKRY